MKQTFRNILLLIELNQIILHFALFLFIEIDLECRLLKIETHNSLASRRLLIAIKCMCIAVVALVRPNSHDERRYNNRRISRAHKLFNWFNVN